MLDRNNRPDLGIKYVTHTQKRRKAFYFIVFNPGSQVLLFCEQFLPHLVA